MDRREFIKTSLMAAGAAGITLMDRTKAIARENKMKILVITGSPRKNGNSNTLAAQFSKGARDAGHEVTIFNAALSNVHPCIACNSCNMDGPCVFDDDFQIVRENIVPASLVAFVTPMYYYGISAQLKSVIDRFYAINGQIHIPKKAVLIMTYANNSPKKEQPIIKYYDQLLDYLGWQDAGRVIAPGMWPVGAVNGSKYIDDAYHLGKSL